jgi:hypothetical protein
VVSSPATVIVPNWSLISSTVILLVDCELEPTGSSR